MKIISLLLTTVSLIAGCSNFRPVTIPTVQSTPVVSTAITANFSTVKAKEGDPVVIAVYGFTDKTGQKKPSATISQFSTAVTQGAESYLIKSLQDVGDHKWFTVVERVGLDNLLKERQMIKQTREIYNGDQAKPLPPLMLAGVLLEGAIVDYNSNVQTGGTGARFLGIGPYTQYTQDLVVISLRLISVQTGEVLTSVTVEKNLLSTADGVTAFKFFNQGTKAFEFDASQTFNEPSNYALRSAIETAIVELINKGSQQGLWKFKEGV